MEINTTNNPVICSFIGKKADRHGEEHVIRVVSYENPIASTTAYGDVHAGAFIEDKKGETVKAFFFQEPLTEEATQKQAEYMITNIDKILEERKNG